MGRPTVGDRGVGLDRVRVLVGAALGPVVTGYAIVASVLVVVMALAPGTEFSPAGVLAAACPAWLAAYQVPLDIGGAPLGVLPLLPTFAVGLLVFRAAMSAVHRLDDLDGSRPGFVSRGIAVVGVVAGGHALTAVAFAGVSIGSPVEARFPDAIVLPTALAAGAALLGVAAASPGWWLDRLDPVAVRGVRAGLAAFCAVVALGAVAFTAATVAAWSTLGKLFDAFSPDPGSAVGMLLLSVAYVPNAVVLTSSVLTGGGFTLGAVSVSAFSMTPGPVPAIPVLAGLPAEYGAWWPLLLAAPAIVGALAGWSLRDVEGGVGARLRAVVVAGVVCGFCALVVAAFTGGQLGGGEYSPVSLRAEVFSLTAFGLVVVPGSLVAWLTGGNTGSRRTPRRQGRRRGL
ncbi:DUF6350 domain-containing protein [Saccharomonospora xinjiangensis]|uniref:cell division protein PerM n=1 Tax=Saccharomonospora xinjiangensis TaxID=75294 RepID=UPI00106F4433|nr:DUF6350 family protein [Saccharomonospora xinjiangensis]QBQ58937.1 hypothetical protein EYD13_02770 [Saccharomonospora xinjiangensis]